MLARSRSKSSGGRSDILRADMDHDDSPWRNLSRRTRRLVWMMGLLCVLVTIELVMTNCYR
jgi:hypothetical protein